MTRGGHNSNLRCLFISTYFVGGAENEIGLYAGYFISLAKIIFISGRMLKPVIFFTLI